jgi:hypothetical protein
MAGYSGTPLVKKLGIKPASRLAIIGAPTGFRKELVDLPAGVRVTSTAIDGADLAIWFVKSRRELERRVASVSLEMGQGLWMAWPKKASGIVTDLNENLIRNAGLAHGLVDYKVCAINDVWSGLKFARRK